jgi:hypothetical protein
MSANPHSGEIAELLRALETVEQLSDERLSSALRQLAHFREDPLPELVRPCPADRNANPIVERIAMAMKLAAKAG